MKVQLSTKQLEKSIIDLTGREYIQSLRTYVDSEWDVCTINKSDYATQWEIKSSVSDFRADFKKPKHKKFKQGIGGNTRRFYFVCPEGMIKRKDIPSYAGLVYVELYEGRPIARVIKKAPLLKANKISNKLKTRLLRSIMYRWLRKEFQDI